MDLLELGSWGLLIVILFASLVYLYGTWTYDYWKKRGIPFVKPVPLVGNTFDVILTKKTVNDIYREIYKELGGYRYGGFFQFREPTLMIRDPELIKSVLVKDFPSFHDNAIKLDINIDPIFGRNPFFLSGERWKITRSQLTPAFTSGKLKPLFPLIMEVCEELRDYLENYKHSGDGIEAKELCARYTTNVVATCAFGIRGDAIHNPKSEIREVGRSILQPGFLRMMALNLLFLFPSLAKMLKLRISTKRVDKFFERVTREVVEHREKNNITRNDFIQMLMNIKQKYAGLNKEESFDPMEFAPEKYRFTNIDVMAQAATFFTDGFETSSIAFSFCLYDLAMHPDVQNKLYLEVEDALKHDGELTFDAVHGMTYLDMVLSESLRQHPPAVMLMKMCTKPFDLETPSGGIYTVEVGTQVHIPCEALHYDSKYFPDPEKYDPERFNEENKSSINKYAYLPFGEGPRVCLGFRFAMTQVKAGIAYLVHHFEIRPTCKTPNPMVLDSSSFLPAAKGGLWLDFVKRKSTA